VCAVIVKRVYGLLNPESALSEILKKKLYSLVEKLQKSQINS
jgi:hypothetical protein